jgi:hypothetical protein
MYTSLAFYYPSTLNPTLDTSTLPNVQLQFQQLTNWLTDEHLQHQQWAGIITRESENSSLYEVKTLLEQQMPSGPIEHFCVNFTPVTVISSKLLHFQLTLCQTRSMFPVLGKVFLASKGFQLLEWPKLNAIHSFPVEDHLKSLLARFRAWFQYSKIYLSFYVRKICLEEDAQLSDTFSNRLMYQWLKGQHIASQTKWLSHPFGCPTQADVRYHLNLVKECLKRLKAVSQSRLIEELNPLLQRWLSSWDLSVRWRTLSYCDDRLRRLLQRWAKRRHPNKGWAWVCHKYWRVGSTATKYIFWLHLLTNSCGLQKLDNKYMSGVHSQLVRFLQANLKECMSLDSSSLSQWQFVCLDVDVSLMNHTAFTLKKWRKNRSFHHFLLY